MKLEKWDKRGSRDPDHHEGCMVSRLLGERRNLDRAQIDQKMRSIRGEQTLSAVYNTPIIYSGLLLLLICLHYLAAYGRQVHSDLFGKLHDVHKLLLHCAHA